MEGTFKRVAVSPVRARIYPRIVLIRCHVCAGRGQLDVIRNRRATQETCVVCAGHGTLTAEA
jgi:DnaJ-class molecular chaperone